MVTDKILNFFFPAKCPFCREIAQRGMVCPHCRDKVEQLKIPTHLMQINHKTLKNVEECISFYYYDGIVRRGILNAKNKSCKTFTQVFLGYISFDFVQYFDKNHIDAVVSMPAHRSKFYYREADLPQQMAMEIAKISGKEYNNSLVIKTKRTRNQHNLKLKQRISNLKNAFTATEAVKGKNIVIIDDIVTSGNSLENVAKALKRAGAAKVFAVTFAYNNKI